MGKTHKGAVWLDPELTSPYDYYQYWINQEDSDVERFLALFTFLPMDEVRRLGALQGSEIRHAKEVLALEATKLCHGAKEAEKARAAARQLFGGDTASLSDSVPNYVVNLGEIEQGIPAYILFEKTGLCKTRSDARRLIAQGGGYLNNEKIQTYDQIIGLKSIFDDSILLRSGKKKYIRISIQEES
jgi:tyrosyl-tRNA synthetase